MVVRVWSVLAYSTDNGERIFGIAVRDDARLYEHCGIGLLVKKFLKNAGNYWLIHVSEILTYLC